MSNIKEIHGKPMFVSFFRVWPPCWATPSNAVVVVVVRTRPRAIPLVTITMRKSTYGFPFLSHDEYGAPLGGPFAKAPLKIEVGKL